MLRPSISAAVSGLLILSQLANPATAACSAFHPAPNAHDDQVPLHTASSSFGARAQQAQAQRVSPGIVCGSKQTIQRYAPSDKSETCPGHQCLIIPRGIVSAVAMTNITGITPHADPTDLDTLLGRIVHLALKSHARFPHDANPTAAARSPLVRGDTSACLLPGDAQYWQWTPRLSCVAGTLAGCTAAHGNTIETDGRAVEVCAPAPHIAPGGLRLSGRLGLRSASPREIARFKDNPAVSGVAAPRRPKAVLAFVLALGLVAAL